ncbi:hypothetical protein N836_28030 [Leptolyngbya sp. Heron Island J]|uniref:hypothetical protein n=1 Tax=Leptolyngbya sp. Heron Island J TaxID=1385935 RepID=UPI0003B957E9|nr:hypothetical protein [Leptolyngbya sp. Heron Island J]ESA32006.1 hypothetical protein N836_28030 [Leptolyngbya sp. Heron Island J]
MTKHSHGLSIASAFFMSGSLLTQIQPAHAENANTDILFTGTVPVTCAFEGLSSVEQLDPQIVVANRLANCNEETRLHYESTHIEPIISPSLSEHTYPDSSRNQELGVITITAH